MRLTWTESLSVGNAMIDSEHKQLITMVNGAEGMIKKMDNFALAEAFDQIEHFLVAHFANEEMIAQAIKLPFIQNKLAHENVMKTLWFMRDVIAGKNGVWDKDTAEHYSELLSDWLSNHIIKEDMLMKPVLQTYPYDFTPTCVRPEFVQIERPN